MIRTNDYENVEIFTDRTLTEIEKEMAKEDRTKIICWTCHASSFEGMSILIRI